MRKKTKKVAILSVEEIRSRLEMLFLSLSLRKLFTSSYDISLCFA
jgi:hypothetical protein